MSFKHLTLTLLLGLAMALPASAIPADPQPKQFRQPDGSMVTFLLRGDERAHVMLSDDGYPLVYNPTKYQLEFARLDGGKLVASGVAASNVSERTAKQAKYVGSIDRRAMINAVLASSKLPSFKGQNGSIVRRTYTEPDGYKHAMINDFPTLGHMKTLCILVEFSDVKFSSINNPKEFYTNMLNEHGFTYSNGANGSARDFYNDASTNQFDPEWDVVGPITLPHTATYYGSDSPSQDARMGELVQYACEKADSMGVDFSQYDYDNDGIVDNICFIYAGYGQADSNLSDVIWPHAAVLSEDWGIDMSCDGKVIGHYFCSNELRYNADSSVKIPTGIGTVVHEFGHILGLPDLYDVSYNMLSSLMGYGLYYWETMAAGSYNNNSNTPPTFSSYERLVLGWLKPKDVTADIDSIFTLPNLADSNIAYRVKVEGKPGEYFMLENRQKKGWDEYVYDHGMLIWHIDEVDSLWAQNRINNVSTHQHVDLVEVTGDQDNNPSHDAMPGSANVSNYQLNGWDGKKVITLDDVSEADSVVSVLVSPSKFTMAAPDSIHVSGLKDSTFTFSWNPVRDAKSYLVSVYKQDEAGNKTYVDTLNNASIADAEPITLTDLTPDTYYNIEVKAVRGSYQSAVVSKGVRTEKLDFTERKSASAKATDVTDTSFKAQWDSIEGSNAYRLTVYRHAFSGQTDSKGYDFTGKADAMPELWSTSSKSYYSVKGYYGNAAPSLRLGKDSDFIVVAFPESRIQKISFWQRSSRETGSLSVQKWANGSWETVSGVALNTAGGTSEVDVNGTDSVRILYNRNGGFVVIDDILATCNSIERQPVDGYNDLNVGNVLEYNVTGLTKGLYSFRVRGERNGQLSLPSDEVQVNVSKVNTVTLGYSNGEIADNSTQTLQGTGHVSAAIHLPASTLAAYKGSQITSIRTALVQRINIDTLTVWVRSSLDGKNIAEGTITRNTDPKIQKGWNEVALTSPYTIGNEDVYIGFTFRQRTNVEAVSQVGGAMYNTSYVKLGDTDWKDVSADGQISLEAVVTGNTVPANDLGLTGAVVSPYPNAGKYALKVTAQVHNYGMNAIEGMSLTLAAHGVSLPVHLNDTIPSTQSKSITFTVDPGTETTDNSWTLTLNGIDSGIDEIAENNVINASYAFLKNVLLEEFTTERCVNCPRVAGFLHAALDNLDDTRVFAVAHHAGFYTDKFTQDWDEPLVWLYSYAGSSYAPAVLMDRQPYFSRDNHTTTAFIPSSESDVETYVNYEFNQVAEAVVGVQLEFNADSSQVEATVNLRKTDHYLTANPHLTVYLVENHIATNDQEGATGTYYQEHVTRATNTTWGDPVEWNGNTANFTYTFNIDPSWNKNNMEVIAFLGNYDENDNLNCVVDNVNGASFVDKTATSINKVASSADGLEEVARYNAVGAKLSAPTRGLNIILYNDGSVRKVVVK